MKFKSIIMTILMILAIFLAISCVSANDVSQEMNLDELQEINSGSETLENIDETVFESDSDSIELERSENVDEKLAIESDFNELSSDMGSEDNSNVVLSTNQEDNDIVSMNVNQEDSKLSSSAEVYFESIKTRYNSGKYFYFGWTGDFDGYFKVYKGTSLYYNEYIYGYDQDLQWSLNGMSPGIYNAKLVKYNGKILGTGKIIIKKSSSKISVKSFSAKAKSKFYCYAYVWDKYTGKNYNGGTVKFKIAGKIYKAKLRNGVAIAKIRIPSKVKTYKCRATFSGGSNVYGKTTTFKIKVKKNSPSKSITFKSPSGYKWKIKKSIWKKMKKQAIKSYSFFRKHGSYHPGYSNSKSVTVTKNGHTYKGIAFAVKNSRYIRCEVRGVITGVYLSNKGDTYV